MGTGGYFFYGQRGSGIQQSAEKSLGFIRPLGTDVRVRGTQDAGWDKIQQDANVFNKDKIFTGASSSATVGLKSNQKLQVEPNSLIVIEDKKDSLNIDLDSGGFFGELKKGFKLIVKKGNTVSEVNVDEKATVQLEAGKDQEVKLVVLKGEVAVQGTADKAPVKVVANDEVKISDKKTEVQPLNVKLISPAPSATLWEKGKALDFSWATAGGKGTEKLVFEISKDPVFDVVVKSFEVKDNSTSVEIPSGTVYFWRVRDKDSDGMRSPTFSFSYFSMKPPQIPEQMNIETEVNLQRKTLSPTYFSWSDPSITDTYLVQIAEDKDFKNVIFKEETQKAKYSTSGLKEGELYWRVISKQSSRESLTSNIGIISVKGTNKPEPPPAPKEERKLATVDPEKMPEPIKPAEPPPPPPPPPPPLRAVSFDRNEYVFELTQDDLIPDSSTGIVMPDLQKDAIVTERPHISWQPSSEAENYEIQYSRDEKFKSGINKESMREHSWIWKKPECGHYFFRVIARRGDEEIPSKIIKFQTRLSPPVLKYSAISAARGELSLDWKSHKSAKQSELQISEDPNFVNTKSEILTVNSFIVAPTETRTVYVRVHNIDSQDLPISRFSNVQKIELTVPLPVAPPPVPEAVFEYPTKSWRDFSIPEYWMWFGLGASYTKFNQSTSGYSAAGFSSIDTPSINIHGGGYFNATHGFDLNYKSTPGKIEKAANVTVNQNNYEWRSIVVEGLYRRDPVKTVFGYMGEMHFRYGIQVHQFPTMIPTGALTVDARSNQILNASMGFGLMSRPRKQTRAEMQLRLQYPISASAMSGDPYSVTPQYNFDGSLGYVFEAGKNWSYGVYWFGQTHKFNYTYRNTITGTAYIGSQELFYTNIDFRLGIEY